MSAFIVPRMHVAALVRWYATHRENWDSDKYSPDYAPKLADTLMAENARSVAFRYHEEEEKQEPFTRQEIERTPKLSPVQVLKGIQCLDYQSCETDDWIRTKARAILDRMQSLAITSIDGYEAAAWTIDEPQIPRAAAVLQRATLPSLGAVLGEIAAPFEISTLAEKARTEAAKAEACPTCGGEETHSELCDHPDEWSTGAAGKLGSAAEILQPELRACVEETLPTSRLDDFEALNIIHDAAACADNSDADALLLIRNALARTGRAVQS